MTQQNNTIREILLSFIEYADKDKSVDEWLNEAEAQINQAIKKAVVAELEFAYKMATPEQKKALKELYKVRGVNKGLSFTPHKAELTSKGGQ